MALVVGVACWLALPDGRALADDASPPAAPILTHFEVYPPAVLPGEPITFTLTLENTDGADHPINVKVALPAGFDLSLTSLPVGAAYNLRSDELRWMATLPADDVRVLTLTGLAPTEPRLDGRLSAYATLTGDQLFPQVVHLSATGWVGTPPEAVFAISTEPGLAGQPVQFSDQSYGVGPLSVWWDFGDGATSTEEHPTHTYTAGEYTVRLTVANPQGTSTTSQVLRIVAPPEPEIQAAEYDMLVSDCTPAVGQPVYFSHPDEDIPVSVRWSFGDGSTSSDANPTHIFQQPGAYTVTRVLGEGTTSIQTSEILIVDHPPLASIQVARPSVLMGELITFTALTSAPEVTSVYWDFGDGHTANHSYVAHSYPTPGDYLVTLAISNDFGVALDTLAVHVRPYISYFPLIATEAMPITAEGATVEIDLVPESVEPEEIETPIVVAEPDPLAEQMLQAINAEREAAGLPPLTWSPQLSRAAQHHTDDMATYGFTGHHGSNGSRPIDRMRQAGYTDDYAGECTAWGFDDLASAVAWWMSSPPHRTIILSTVATEMGGAYTYNASAPSVHYWTIDFGAH